MVLRIVLSIVLGAMAFTLGGPVLYYFWVGPQSAAALALAKEFDDEIKRLSNAKTFSREDYRASSNTCGSASHVSNRFWLTNGENELEPG